MTARYISRFGLYHVALVDICMEEDEEEEDQEEEEASVYQCVYCIFLERS